MCVYVMGGIFFFFAKYIKLMVLVADIVMHFFRALLPSQMSHTTRTRILHQYASNTAHFGRWLWGDWADCIAYFL